MTTKFEHLDVDSGLSVIVEQEGDMDSDELCDLLFQFCCAAGYFPSSIAKSMREKAQEIEDDLRMQVRGLDDQ